MEENRELIQYGIECIRNKIKEPVYEKLAEYMWVEIGVEVVCFDLIQLSEKWMLMLYVSGKKTDKHKMNAVTFSDEEKDKISKYFFSLRKKYGFNLDLDILSDPRARNFYTVYGKVKVREHETEIKNIIDKYLVLYKPYTIYLMDFAGIKISLQTKSHQKRLVNTKLLRILKRKIIRVLQNDDEIKYFNSLNKLVITVSNVENDNEFSRWPIG